MPVPVCIFIHNANTQVSGRVGRVVNFLFVYLSFLCNRFVPVFEGVSRALRFSATCVWYGSPMAYNVVAALLSWQLILRHLTVVQASTHWVVTEDGRIQAQVIMMFLYQCWASM